MPISFTRRTKTGSATSQVYVHWFFERIASRFDLLVDMHTASTGRINSLYVRADMTHQATAQMAYLQRPQIIVHNPPHDGTLRGAATALGIPSITVEIGNPQRFQPELIGRSLKGLREVLAHAGMIEPRDEGAPVDPVVCERSYWRYTDHGGLLVVRPHLTERVRRGEVLARLSNVFGDVVCEYIVDEDAVIVGKAVDPVADTGARIAHLGVVSDDPTTYFSREDAVGGLEEYHP